MKTTYTHPMTCRLTIITVMMCALSACTPSQESFTFDPAPPPATGDGEGELYPLRSKITSTLPELKGEMNKLLGYSDLELHRWGYVNDAGQLVVKQAYGSAEPHSDGLAVISVVKRVVTDGSANVYRYWGAIDRRGALVVPTSFKQLAPFSDGLARAQIPAPTFSMHREKGKIYEGFINAQGEFVIEFELGKDMKEAGDFSEGLAWVHPSIKYGDAKKYMSEANLKLFTSFMGDSASDDMMVRSGNTPYGFIDKTGKMTIPPRYSAVTSFSEGRAAVQDAKTGKWGFIDHKGAWVIAAEYDYAEPSRDGLAPVTRGERCGYVDHKGQVKIPLIYQTCWGFSEGRAVVKTSEKSFLVVDAQGATQPLLKSTPSGKIINVGSFHSGLISIKIKSDERSLWGFADTRGVMTIPPRFSDYKTPHFRGALARVEVTTREPSTEEWNKGKLVDRTKFGYIDQRGAWRIEPVPAPSGF